MTKFEPDRTFMKKLGLAITNMPEVAAVENSTIKADQNGHPKLSKKTNKKKKKFFLVGEIA